MALSKRLLAIAKLIDTDQVIDVGCDHGLLDIYLFKTRKLSCIAIDNKRTALNQARANIEKAHLEKFIKTILSDGLSEVFIPPSSTVVLAGMGFETIRHIALDEKEVATWIVQSNNQLYQVREFFHAKGYYLVEEVVIEERQLYYIIMKWQLGEKRYSDSDLKYGPILKTKKESIDYFQYLLKKETEILKKRKTEEEKMVTLSTIKELEEIINNIKKDEIEILDQEF